MKTKQDAVDENLQFAYEANRDDNAYTSEKPVCKILADGSAALRENKVVFACSVFPELKQR
jgi:hypothetical protein